MFESRVQRVVFGPKTETVLEEWRNCTMIIIFVYQKLSGQRIRGDEREELFSTHEWPLDFEYGGVK
jgi:hypothetical protein